MLSSGIRRSDPFRDMQDCEWVIGVDEVGLGAWAGPMCLGGVLAKRDFKLAGLRDSKQMTERQRERMIDDIYLNTIDTVGALRTAQQIVDNGHAESWTDAAFEVICSLLRHVNKEPSLVHVIIDGSSQPTFQNAKREMLGALPVSFVVSADDRFPQVSAASVMAKVYRDTIMKSLHVKHPEYGWSNNKGYGTRAHREALEEYGSTQYHRAHARKHWPVRTISDGEPACVQR